MTLMAQWARYRRWRRAAFMLLVGWLPFGFFLLVLAPEPPPVTSWRSVAALAYFVCMMAVGHRSSYWPCPRCGRPFSVNEERMSASDFKSLAELRARSRPAWFVKHCVYCGLAEGSPTSAWPSSGGV